MITAIDKNTALVVIDLQKGIVKTKRAHPVKDIVDKSSLLIDAFRKAELPVVIVNVTLAGAKWLASRKDEKRLPTNAFGLALVRLMTRLTGFSKIVKEINTKPTDIFITKNVFNAFYDTPLSEELRKRNITGIVLCGIATSSGVEGTARAASEQGYNIGFAMDAMTDSSMESHLNSMNNIFPRLGEVGTTADIIDKLGRRG